jgi:hypothetical protein
MTFSELADQWVKTKVGEVKDGSLVRLRGIAAHFQQGIGGVAASLRLRHGGLGCAAV